MKVKHAIIGPNNADRYNCQQMSSVLRMYRRMDTFPAQNKASLFFLKCHGNFPRDPIHVTLLMNLKVAVLQPKPPFYRDP